VFTIRNNTQFSLKCRHWKRYVPFTLTPRGKYIVTLKMKGSLWGKGVCKYSVRGQASRNLVQWDKVKNLLRVIKKIWAGPSGHVVIGLGLRPLACWDCGIESHRSHRCSSVVSVVCCLCEDINKYLSIEVLPTVVRRCVWSRNLVNEDALAHWEMSHQKQANKQQNLALDIWHIWGIKNDQNQTMDRRTFAINDGYWDTNLLGCTVIPSAITYSCNFILVIIFRFCPT
jgi:hypothetical protein